ncbi:hypothetical protein BC831DRAFT_509982 [Entophlyctis helioformis]|nr:hypothetical protein BC831DRAFT_509982 [Entophlyctis helioformis]
MHLETCVHSPRECAHFFRLPMVCSSVLYGYITMDVSDQGDDITEGSTHGLKLERISEAIEHKLPESNDPAALAALGYDDDLLATFRTIRSLGSVVTSNKSMHLETCVHSPRECAHFFRLPMVCSSVLYGYITMDVSDQGDDITEGSTHGLKLERISEAIEHKLPESNDPAALAALGYDDDLLATFRTIRSLGSVVTSNKSMHLETCVHSPRECAHFFRLPMVCSSVLYGYITMDVSDQGDDITEGSTHGLKLERISEAIEHKLPESNDPAALAALGYDDDLLATFRTIRSLGSVVTSNKSMHLETCVHSPRECAHFFRLPMVCSSVPYGYITMDVSDQGDDITEGSTHGLKLEKISIPVVADGHDIRGLILADDVAILAESHAALADAVEVVAAWADKWKMAFGVDKCGIMAFFKPPTSNAGNDPPDVVIMLQGYQDRPVKTVDRADSDSESTLKGSVDNPDAVRSVTAAGNNAKLESPKSTETPAEAFRVKKLIKKARRVFKPSGKKKSGAEQDENKTETKSDPLPLVLMLREANGMTTKDLKAYIGTLKVPEREKLMRAVGKLEDPLPKPLPPLPPPKDDRELNEHENNALATKIHELVNGWTEKDREVDIGIDPDVSKIILDVLFGAFTTIPGVGPLAGPITSLVMACINTKNDVKHYNQVIIEACEFVHMLNSIKQFALVDRRQVEDPSANPDGSDESSSTSSTVKPSDDLSETPIYKKIKADVDKYNKEIDKMAKEMETWNKAGRFNRMIRSLSMRHPNSSNVVPSLTKIRKIILDKTLLHVAVTTDAMNKKLDEALATGYFSQNILSAITDTGVDPKKIPISELEVRIRLIQAMRKEFKSKYGTLTSNQKINESLKELNEFEVSFSDQLAKKTTQAAEDEPVQTLETTSSTSVADDAAKPDPSFETQDAETQEDTSGSKVPNPAVKLDPSVGAPDTMPSSNVPKPRKPRVPKVAKPEETPKAEAAEMTPEAKIVALLNRGTKTELMELTWIGPKRADDILKARNGSNNFFQGEAELASVIGPGWAKRVFLANSDPSRIPSLKHLVARMRLRLKTPKLKSALGLLCPAQPAPVGGRLWYWTRRSIQLYNRYIATPGLPDGDPDSKPRLKAYGLAVTLKSASKCDTAAIYTAFQMQKTANIIRDPVFDPRRSEGARFLMLARVGGIYTARRAINANLLDPAHPFGHGSCCIMCGEDLGSTLEIAHFALECTEERIVAIRTEHAWTHGSQQHAP